MRMVSHSLVQAFIQGVMHMVSPVVFPLPLRFRPGIIRDIISLQRPPFKPIQNPISASDLESCLPGHHYLRVSQLAAVSCRKRFLILHNENVDLQTSFLPKGSLIFFHLNLHIALPSFSMV